MGNQSDALVVFPAPPAGYPESTTTNAVHLRRPALGMRCVDLVPVCRIFTE